MLEGSEGIPFGDLDTLKKKLAGGKFAAFFVEPIQSEAGVRVSGTEYLAEAASLCHRHGTLLVLDEVQTGLYRTGTFLAAHQFHVKPDMVVLAKALSGGLVPVSAVLMTDHIYRSVYDSLKGSIVHTSTFGENGLAMRAGLATLDVLEEERLGDHAMAMGEYLRGKLRERLSGFPMVVEVRGLGLLSGIEFRAPSQMTLRVPFEAFRAIHPGMFGQILVMRLYRDWDILTQICGNNFMVLKAAPPLRVTGDQIDRFVDALGSVVELMHSSPSYWTEALGLARRAANI
jgi:ornithine--oxo-acid transaminase